MSNDGQVGTLRGRVGLALEAVGLVKTYGKGDSAVRALDGVGIAVPAGTVYALLGPNGAGKSTIVRILTTLSRADSGRAHVAGFDVERDAARVRRVIGYVPQKPSFDPAATGRENLALQGRIHGIPARDLQERAVGLLDRFDLGDAADRVAKTWSGGMQRKLDIALALIHRPHVLFLDEPTTGLDPEARAGMWAEITRLSESEGLTVLMTTHYMEEADRLADRLAIIDRGRVVASGTPDELKAELASDRIEVEVADRHQSDRARAVLARFGDPGTLRIDGTSLRARVADGVGALPAVLTALTSARIEATSISVARPSLDDVYLRHAGRDFPGADVASQRETA